MILSLSFRRKRAPEQDDRRCTCLTGAEEGWHGVALSLAARRRGGVLVEFGMTCSEGTELRQLGSASAEVRLGRSGVSKQRMCVCLCQYRRGA